MRKEISLFALDLAAFTAGLSLALHLRFSGSIPAEHLLPYLTFLPLILSIRVAAALVFGLYDFRRRLSPVDHIFGAAAAASCAVGFGYVFLVIVQLYYSPELKLSRIVGLIDLAFLFAWLALSRGLVLWWLRMSGYRVRVALMGPVQACQNLASEISKYAPPLIEVEGIVTLTHSDSENENVLGTANELAQIVAEREIDQIILAQVDLPQDELRDLLAHCDSTPAEFFLYPELGLPIFANTRVISIAGIPLIPLRPAFERSAYRYVKRALDLCSAAAILLITAPVVLPVMAAVRMSSPGKALFSQERAGYGGDPFRMYKIRTMRANAEEDTGPVLASGHDARVTPIGRVLRKMRIDEIPQLWNVLRGDMSLVGPRPERCEFVEEFLKENPLYERRLLVKPGLTGLAQIHGGYESEYTHKLRYDLIYINSISLASDLRILLATVRAVLTGKGAV